MAHPTRVVPGPTYFITRRCYQRTFRLRPCDETNQVVMYCLALAATRTGVVLHAAKVMSNHHHMLVTDVEGRLPEFLRELHRSIAKCLNALHGQSENLWAAKPTDRIQLLDEQVIIDKLAYLAANAVSAGLVAVPEEWPGIALWKEQTFTVKRPDVYFEANGSAPDQLTLSIRAPIVDRSPQALDSWQRRVRAAVALRVAAAHRKLREAGLKFLGRAAILDESFVGRAASDEPDRGRSALVAASNPGLREAMLLALKAFRARYRAALSEWRAGARDVQFPYGTWWMRVHHNVACELRAEAAGG